MIPRKIHYCWLGNNPFPKFLRKCIHTWQKKLPDYEFILWDENRFDVNSTQWTRESYSVKKWAFVTDYIRLYALYTEGGIYLDTDVIIKKDLSDFLKYDFFSAVEYHPDIVKKQQAVKLLNADWRPRKSSSVIPGIGILSAIMGSTPKHPYVKDMLSYYKDRPFILSDKSFDSKIIAPAIYAEVALKYGFRYQDIKQTLLIKKTNNKLKKNNSVIFPSKIFAGNILENTKESYAVHCCQNSWNNPLYVYLAKNNFVRWLLGKKKLTNIDNIINY